MKISEAILLAVLAVFSLVLLISSLDMPYGTEQTFGPGFLPLNLSAALLVAIGILAVKAGLAARKARAASPHPAAGKGEDRTEAAAKTGVLVAAVALVAIATLAMKFIGVLPAVVVMMALISWRFSGHSPLKSAAVSVSSVIAIYLIFEVWLHIPLTS